jgi:hypothetical protein
VVSDPLAQMSWAVVPCSERRVLCRTGRIALTALTNRGRLVKDRATGEAKLNCRNWECGVIIPITAGAGAGEPSQSHGQDELGGIFGGTVPVPMELPGNAYGAEGSPWFFLDA